MFAGLTAAICEKAWNIVLSSVDRAAETGTTNKFAGTIVVLNPANGTVLFEQRVEETHPDAEKYDEFAHAKAQVCWETKLPSRVVQQSAPHLYRPGMVKWGGGVIENGLVVAFSGVQAVYDEAIAWSVLKWIIALCQNEMTKTDGMMATESSYIGGMSASDTAMAFDAAGAAAEQRMAGR